MKTTGQALDNSTTYIDLPDRTDREAGIADAIAVLFGKWGAEIERRLTYDDKTNDDFPLTFWQDMQIELAAELSPHLESTYLAGVVAVGMFATDEGRIQREAKEWAKDRADQLASAFVNRSIEEWKRFESQLSMVDQNGLVVVAGIGAAAVAGLASSRLFTESRATSIAITETTAAFSRGELDTLRRVQDNRRIIGELDTAIAVTWYTKDDDRVCPTCSGLHGKPIEEWEVDFPDGPPAHVNCRCVLRWDL